MDLPDQVLVFGRHWKLQSRSNMFADEDAWGITQTRTGCITMDPEAPQPRVLLHELMHAAEEGLEERVDHGTLDRLAAGLADAFMSRPELADWMVEKILRS